MADDNWDWWMHRFDKGWLHVSIVRNDNAARGRGPIGGMVHIMAGDFVSTLRVGKFFFNFDITR